VPWKQIAAERVILRSWPERSVKIKGYHLPEHGEVFMIHRLHSEGLSVRAIARKTDLNRRTVAKCLKAACLSAKAIRCSVNRFFIGLPCRIAGDRLSPQKWCAFAKAPAQGAGAREGEAPSAAAPRYSYTPQAKPSKGRNTKRLGTSLHLR
jgi:hypothetical protein